MRPMRIKHKLPFLNYPTVQGYEQGVKRDLKARREEEEIRERCSVSGTTWEFLPESGGKGMKIVCRAHTDEG